jgi:Rv0078B-related antitoxin
MSASDRFRTALDMFEFGEAMVRQRATREHPTWTAEQVSEHVRAWLETRPGAEHGDAVGSPGRWPRTRAP